MLRNLAQTASVIASVSHHQHRLICSLTPGISLLTSKTPLLNQQRYAARKGTRDRKTKSKVKTEVKKEEFVPYKVKLAKQAVPDGPARKVEIGKPEAVDDVYCVKHFMTRVISLKDAIQFHKETNHPTVYNKPNALITVKVELDMKLDKKNRYLDNFNRILLPPHHFYLNEPRKIVAFCKTTDTQEEAIAGGADAYGGVELVKRIQSGEVNLGDYDYFVAHPNMINEIVPIRGLMKRRFPSIKTGSLGTNLAEMIELFSKGIEFSSVKDSFDLDYGVVNVPFGRLTMDTTELETNFTAILKDIESCRMRQSGAFITRCFILSPPSREQFVVDPEIYIGKSKQPATPSQEESDDENDQDEEVEEETQSRKGVSA